MTSAARLFPARAGMIPGVKPCLLEIDGKSGDRFSEAAYEKAVRNLADLIDPTCHGIEELEPDGIGAPPRYTSRCSNCGQLWDETDGMPRFPEYCPSCGARVTEGETDERA